MIQRAVKPMLAATLASGMLLPAPVLAQLDPYVQTGTRLAKNTQSIDPKTVRRMEKSVARCIYSRDPDRANRVLANSDPYNIEFDRLTTTAADLPNWLNMDTCLSRTMDEMQLAVVMTIPASRLRPILAEEAYLAAHSVALTIPEGSEETISSRFFVESDEQQSAKNYAFLADCTVKNAPEEADRLLRTRPTSSEESAAVQAVVPALSACVRQNQDLELNVTLIRAIVADGLWSRSHYGSITETEAAE